MDIYAQNPEAIPLTRLLGQAVALAAPMEWPVAELEVRVLESAKGLTRELRIVSRQTPKQTVTVPAHIYELAWELEQMYEEIGQLWGLFVLTITRDEQGFRINTYSEFRG